MSSNKLIYLCFVIFTLNEVQTLDIPSGDLLLPFTDAELSNNLVEHSTKSLKQQLITEPLRTPLVPPLDTSIPKLKQIVPEPLRTPLIPPLDTTTFKTLSKPSPLKTPFTQRVPQKSSDQSKSVQSKFNNQKSQNQQKSKTFPATESFKPKNTPRQGLLSSAQQQQQQQYFNKRVNYDNEKQKSKTFPATESFKPKNTPRQGLLSSPQQQQQQQQQHFNKRVNYDNENYAKILQYKNELYDNGAYHYQYKTDNGINVHEEGQPKIIAAGTPPQQAEQVHGDFSYTSPEGQHIELNYVANEFGFQPVGKHLPTPPPVPEYIQRAIKYILARQLKDQQH